MPDVDWTAEQIEGILDEGNVVFVLQERDQPSKYLRVAEVRPRTADEIGVFLETDAVEMSAPIVEMAKLQIDNLALRRTINVVSKALRRAMPGLALSGIRDEEVIRIWNECSN